MFVNRENNYIKKGEVYFSSQYEGQEWLDDDSREMTDYISSGGEYTEAKINSRKPIQDFKNHCCDCCKDRLLTQYDLGIKYQYHGTIYWIKANDNTQLQVGSKKVALVGKTDLSSVDLSWFSDGYYAEDDTLIKEKRKIIFSNREDVNDFLLRVSDYFQGCINANQAKKEEISLCQSKNDIECLSDIVFPSNKL